MFPAFLSAGSITHTFAVSLEDVTFTSLSGYDVMVLRSGVHTNDVGDPCIAFLIGNFVISADTEVIDVEGIDKETIELPGLFDGTAHQKTDCRQHLVCTSVGFLLRIGTRVQHGGYFF